MGGEELSWPSRCASQILIYALGAPHSRRACCTLVHTISQAARPIDDKVPAWQPPASVLRTENYGQFQDAGTPRKVQDGLLNHPTSGLPSIASRGVMHLARAVSMVLPRPNQDLVESPRLSCARRALLEAQNVVHGRWSPVLECQDRPAEEVCLPWLQLHRPGRSNRHRRSRNVPSEARSMRHGRRVLDLIDRLRCKEGGIAMKPEQLRVSSPRASRQRASSRAAINDKACVHARISNKGER